MTDFMTLPDFALLDEDRTRFLERLEELREHLIEHLADLLDADEDPEDLVEALEPVLSFYNDQNPEFAVSPWVRANLDEDRPHLEAYVPFEGEDEIYDDALLERLDGGLWWFVDEEPPVESGEKLKAEDRRDIHEHVAYHLVALFAWGGEDVEW
ncbi:MAG: hypothetical protein ACNA8W_07340 [Bradymonadaceae bacterium]